MESRPVLQRDPELLLSKTPPSWVRVRSSGKPLLRGWFHGTAAVAALVLTLALLTRPGETAARRLPLLIFSASMCELYTVSAVFHLGIWRRRAYDFLRTLDHSSIYVAIASTYTPLCVGAFSGWIRALLLGSVWLLALAGIALTVLRPHLSRGLRTSLYVALGWMAAPALPALWVTLPPPAMGILLLGGLLYSLGGIIYVRRLPDPFPRVLGYHEVFHLCVVAGSSACAAVICLWVASLL